MTGFAPRGQTKRDSQDGLSGAKPIASDLNATMMGFAMLSPSYEIFS
jgi:hypothetical protein